MNTSNDPADADGLTAKWQAPQFSLRQLLLLMVALSVAFAVAVQFPRQSAFALSMTLLLACPLTIAALAIAVLGRLGVVKIDKATKRSTGRFSKLVNRIQPVARFWGLSQPDNSPPLATSAVVALVSTAAVVGLWPAIREIGLIMALALAWPLEQVWSVAQGLPRELSNAPYWLRLWQWQLWAVGRWWLLFAAITLVWLVVSTPFKYQLRRERAAEIASRLLLFAPWITVLELSFLAGVWIHTPVVVPEPSTGFVVGVFSWQLWHWDCWLDHQWLVRGALPTFAAGLVFFRTVLRWRWAAVVVAALCLIPVALLLSIASTVLYTKLFLGGFAAFRVTESTGKRMIIPQDKDF